MGELAPDQAAFRRGLHAGEAPSRTTACQLPPRLLLLLLPPAKRVFHACWGLVKDQAAQSTPLHAKVPVHVCKAKSDLTLPPSFPASAFLMLLSPVLTLSCNPLLQVFWREVGGWAQAPVHVPVAKLRFAGLGAGELQQGVPRCKAFAAAPHPYRTWPMASLAMELQQVSEESPGANEE